MKITTDHYNQLSDAIEHAIVNAGGRERIEAHKTALSNDSRVKDSAMRLRWDILYAIPQAIRQPLIDELYKYMNDSHIDTALKAILKDKQIA